MRRAEWIVGFGVGVSIGTAFLIAKPSKDGHVAEELDTPIANAQNVVGATAYDPIPQDLRASVQSPSSNPTFDEMVAEVAKANGGKISLREMQALARIAGNMDGGRNRLSDVRQYSYGLSEFATSNYDEIDHLQIAGPGRVTADNVGTYRGSSGVRYKYDLSNPGDRLKYEVDPMAQLEDSISIDPRVEIDRSLGQYGGGIER